MPAAKAPTSTMPRPTPSLLFNREFVTPSLSDIVVSSSVGC